MPIISNPSKKTLAIKPTPDINDSKSLDIKDTAEADNMGEDYFNSAEFIVN